MHSSYREAHFAHRRAQIDTILASPHIYKVCSQCLAIAFKWTPLCPYCRAYRWLESPEAVVTVAAIMRTSPWPRKAGYVPRLPRQVPQPKKTGRSSLEVVIRPRRAIRNQ